MNTNSNRSITHQINDSSISRAVSESIIRLHSQSLIERATQLEDQAILDTEAGLKFLSIDDLEQAITSARERHDNHLSRIEALIESNDQTALIEGIKLHELLSNDVLEKEILQKGIILLKHHHFKEALEWWRLNRETVTKNNTRFEFLLLIMEAFTYLLMGNSPKLMELRNKIRIHKLYNHYREDS